MKLRQERDLLNTSRRARGPLAQCKLGDLTEYYVALGLSSADSMTSSAVTDALYERIASAAARSGDATIKLEDLRRHLTLRWLADAQPYAELVRMLDVVHDASRADIVPAPSEDARWAAILGPAKDYLRLRGDPSAPYVQPRLKNVARAIGVLRSCGFRVQVAGGRAAIHDTEQRRIADEIESSIRSSGGFAFADFLFRGLAPSFDPDQGRHHMVRRMVSSSNVRPIPIPPTGYLLQLCAKHATGRPEAEFSDVAARATVHLAIALADTMDVRALSNMEGLFANRETIIAYLRELVTYDSAYTVPQLRPKDAPRMLRGLFDWVLPFLKLPDLDCTVGEFVEVVDGVVSAANFQGPGLLSRAQVKASVPTATCDVGAVLDACSHEPGGVNASYRLMSDGLKADHWRKPFVRDPAGYFMLDPSTSALAFYEVLVESLRKTHQNVDIEVGLALERVVRKALAESGVPSSTGRYRIGKDTFECDVVVETPDEIVLIECKKKVLQRRSREGNPVALLVDLSDAMVSSQLQAARHELVLYRDGKLELDDGAVKRTVLRGDRSVERVSLSHLDFGSLQDRRVTSQVLELLVGAAVTSSDQTANQQLAPLRKRCNELFAVQTELGRYRDFGPNAFYNCSFMSLGQLLVILDNVSTPKKFWRELRRCRAVSMGTLDFYYEYAQMRAGRSEDSEVD